MSPPYIAHVTDPPFASVVIPTCNRPELLSACLEKLARAIDAAGRPGIEFIVSDDSSDARTLELIHSRYPWARWVRGPRRGPAANRNTGVAAANGSWVIFTDDDCLPDSLWLQAYVDAMERNPSCKVFEGKTVADRERRSLDEESPVNETGGYLWSCNMAIRRDLFERMGGFCETFPYAAMEDVDLRLRLQDRGERFPFVPGAVVCHPLRAAKGLRFSVKIGKSYLHLLDRHPALLGNRPWRTFVLTYARRSKRLLHDAAVCRGRGLVHAAASLAVDVYFDVAARLRSAAKRPPRRLHPAA